ncbi:MAG: ATP-dependent helicase HrpB [Pirellulaceae bacterium]|nr:ATP-dependent helicase HrpB [Pirellulaceae bacterium]
MQPIKIHLPIDVALPEIVAAVRGNACVVVEAPPGAGKTTRVAPALLGECTQKVVLVQPRRIAARASADRIANELQAEVGGLVGYHVRFDRRVSAATRLVAMTPGILLRQLQSDIALADVAVVILDEFHERSLEYDLLLGMLRRVQMELRPDLRLVVMSATLNTDSIREYLNQPPVISVPGQLYPVDIHYSRFGVRGKLTDLVAEQTAKAATEQPGDVLVFLPGAGEIDQVARQLEGRAAREDWEVMRLFGEMSAQDQDRVLQPNARRKIILSTNIAETSLTIDGVRIVVDSGWARVQRVDPSLGLNCLELEPITKASAAQRAGRAGRTAPGVCYRMWDEVTHRSRPEHLEPEILRVDLAGAVLQLLCWGESKLIGERSEGAANHENANGGFPWVTAPRESAIDLALQLLERIDAISAGQPTALGRRLVQLPVHPRLGRLLIEGHALKIPRSAALAAAMLSERDVFDRTAQATGSRQPYTRTQHHHDCDVTNRLSMLQDFLRGRSGSSTAIAIKPGAARQVARIAEQLDQQVQQSLGRVTDEPLEDQLPRVLLAAFPDRLAKRRGPNDARGLMVGGRGVKLESSSGVRQAELFLCIDVDAGGSEASVRQASAIEPEWLPIEHLSQRDDRFMHPTQGTVVTRRRTYWLDLVIEETPIATPLDEATAELLAGAAVQQWHKVIPSDDKSLNSWLGRVRWLAEAMPDSDLPVLTPSGLRDSLIQWCYGMRSIDELKQLPWRSLLEGLLDANQRRLLQQNAPENFTLPSGRTVTLQYEVGKPPILAARIQEFFGLADTPRVAGGRVPLLLHLLAPNMRCQQITDDLASFWKNTYSVVRKELRARYPKHAWPENPMS